MLFFWHIKTQIKFLAPHQHGKEMFAQEFAEKMVIIRVNIDVLHYAETIIQV